MTEFACPTTGNECLYAQRAGEGYADFLVGEQRRLTAMLSVGNEMEQIMGLSDDDIVNRQLILASARLDNDSTVKGFDEAVHEVAQGMISLMVHCESAEGEACEASQKTDWNDQIKAMHESRSRLLAITVSKLFPGL